MKRESEIFCIDLSLNNPEIEAYNEIVQLSSIPVSYHCPSLKGMASLYEREKLVEVKGLMVLGSAASILDGLSWQLEFHPWLETWLRKKVPILGICYGHQLIAYLLGAKVGRMATGIKHVGLREIEFFNKNPLGIKEEKKSKVVVCHQDEVKDLPEDMVVFARSIETPFEGLYHKNFPIFTFQSHPQARYDFYNQRGVKVSEGDFTGGRMIVKSFLNFI
jgi:GMP synthase-like glutamine amidotransferase